MDFQIRQSFQITFERRELMLVLKGLKGTLTEEEFKEAEVLQAQMQKCRIDHAIQAAQQMNILKENMENASKNLQESG